MSNPVCISPLKFYDSLAKQSHRKSYAYGHISPLITKTGWVPPFQFIIPTQLYANGGKSKNLFDKNNQQNGYYVDWGSGLIYISDARSNRFKASAWIEIPNGATVLYLSGTMSDSQGVIYKDAEGNYLKPVNSNYEPLNSYQYASRIFYVPQTAKYVCFTTQFDGSPSNWDDIQLEVGDHATEYEPFGEFYACKIYSQKTNNYITDIPQAWISIRQIDGFIVLLFDGKNRIAGVPEGLYYVKITSGNGGLWTYYSEVFCFTNVTKDCLELEYWNETGNFAVKNGVIAFPADFHFKLLLKGEIGKPEYNFEEESTKRLGYVYVESQVSKKTYKFNTVVPEYICDALRLVRLCDNKIIRCKDDEYEAITFEMEAEWQTQGDLASVTCEFETDNVVANIGGFVPDKLGGDYNNDYNEDFDKE